MPEFTDKDAIQELLKLGSLPAVPQVVAGGNTPYVVIPDNFKVEGLDRFIFNQHNKAPERIKQTIDISDAISFVAYYNLFSDENSRVFANEQGLQVAAVLDYHGAKEGAPRWGEHKVRLALRKSPEWVRWTDKNNKKFSQQEFAEFLEQNSVDITSPSPASVMEIARDLDASTEGSFSSGVRMADGSVRFKYTEEVKATVGGNQIAVPDRFTLAIPVFVGSQRVMMDALLRFRVESGKLSMWFTLVRPEEVIRTAFLAERDSISKTLGIEIINGSLV